jgi:hypothetical protein
VTSGQEELANLAALRQQVAELTRLTDVDDDEAMERLDKLLNLYYGALRRRVRAVNAKLLKDGIYADQTGVACPRCGAEVVYNGNYFCERWTYPYAGGEDECDWALSHDDETGEPVTDEDRQVWAQIRLSYPRLREYLEQHPEEDR